MEALAGSRSVCDLGWLGYGQQVGQAGVTVMPRLYLALGMQNAGFIVAVNLNPQAPLHGLADVSLFVDLTAFITVLLAVLENLK